MDLSLYMENAGTTAGMRALFSYMTEPQGSYYLPMIFSNVLKKKKISFTEKEKHRWNNFLADYFVFRFFIARHVLKTYAAEYTPLLYAFRGISKQEEHFPEFLQPDRFRKDAKTLLSLSDADLSVYTPEYIAEYHRSFEEISKKAELCFNDPDRILKAITEEALPALARKTEFSSMHRSAGFLTGRQRIMPTTFLPSSGASFPYRICFRKSRKGKSHPKAKPQAPFSLPAKKFRLSVFLQPSP